MAVQKYDHVCTRNLYYSLSFQSFGRLQACKKDFDSVNSRATVFLVLFMAGWTIFLRTTEKERTYIRKQPRVSGLKSS